MKLAEIFLTRVLEQLQALARTQREGIEQAAGWFADALASEHWIYLFGTGHSHMLAEELFYRAGGLARVVPMLYEPLMLHASASESTRWERDIEVVPRLFERYPIQAEDVLVVASNSGRNAVPVELALQARRRGARVVAIVNRQQCERWPSRHPSGQRLSEVAELVLDNCGVEGDACVPVPELGLSVGPTSTIAGAALLQMIVCGAVEKAIERGLHPEIFCSSNTVGDDTNAAILAKYRGRVPHL